MANVIDINCDMGESFGAYTIGRSLALAIIPGAARSGITVIAAFIWG